LTNLLTLQVPISLALVKIDKSGYSKEVLSLKEIEWRHILQHGKLEFNVEFPSAHNSHIRIGLVNIFLELLPKKPSNDRIPERRLEEQLTSEKKSHTANVKRFFDFSNEWWKEYKSLNPSFENRAVKIYCGNETGAYKPVFTYVTPLKIRGIDSPNHAARFISLIPFHRSERPGGEKSDCWKTFHTFLAEGRGDSEDHANFLCSLLLGFGLEAYIVVGVSSDGGHYWVMTRDAEKVGNKERSKVVFWESLTGQKYEQKDPRVNYMYRRVGSVYNHQRLYANLQENDQCPKTDFGFESKKLWKTMGNLEEFGFTTIQNVRALRMSMHANLALDEEE
jgi:centrosomal protein CEP76